jgi:hydroxymethylpyrimidine/phosphomethylpyrimidine kinase
MAKTRVFVASIAGYDPSAGAGTLADIKTFEMHKVYGFGVSTALTWQNDKTVKEVRWLSVPEIVAQLELLLIRFRIDWFKIGIIENAQSLLQLCRHLKHLNPEAGIIWDPVIKSSSGYPFFTGAADWQSLQPYLDWITPNVEEFEALVGSEEEALRISENITIYQKGGHDEQEPGKDWLYMGGEKYPLNPKKVNVFPKHGSGCILSAALCANLAKGYPPLKACLRSKRYIEKVLNSNPGLLGWHNS